MAAKKRQQTSLAPSGLVPARHEGSQIGAISEIPLQSLAEAREDLEEDAGGVDPTEPEDEDEDDG